MLQSISQNILLTTTTTTNHQPTRKGTLFIQSKRIFWALLIAAMLVISTTVTQAQSTGRQLWPRGGAGNHPVPVVPEQAPVAEPEPAFQEAQALGQGGFLDTLAELLARQKTAIVGSWLGISSEGNRILLTLNSDGTTVGSVQGGVSLYFMDVLTSGHGVWKHLGGRQFGYTSRSVLYDINTGAYKGYLKARLMLTLNEAGDQLTGEDKVEIFDPAGQVVFTATGTTTFTRIKFEPFN